jgi:hypothetical protein
MDMLKLDGGERPQVLLNGGDRGGTLLCDFGERGCPLIADSGPDRKADSGPGWQHFGPPEGDGLPVRKNFGFDAGERGMPIFLEDGPGWSLQEDDGPNRIPVTCQGGEGGWHFGPGENNQRLTLEHPEGNGGSGLFLDFGERCAPFHTDDGERPMLFVEIGERGKDLVQGGTGWHLGPGEGNQPILH